MTRSFPIIFGQQDYPQQLGSKEGSTIALHGCYLCSFATLARACGKNTDPIELNRVMTERGLYEQGNLMFGNNLTKVFPDLVYQTTYEFPNEKTNPDGSISPAVPADLNLLKQLMDDPSNWVLLKIHLNQAPFTHFVLCAGVNGVVKIADPMTKQVDDFSTRYGDPVQNILRFIVYKGNPAQVNEGTSEKVVTDLRLERDRNWNIATEVISRLGVAIMPDDIPGMVEAAKNKIDNYATQIAGYKMKAEEFQQKYESELKQNIEINEANKTVSGENQDNAEKAYAAEHLARERGEYLQKIGDELEINYPPNNDKRLVDEVLNKISTTQKQNQELIKMTTPVNHMNSTPAKKTTPRYSPFKTIINMFYVQR